MERKRKAEYWYRTTTFNDSPYIELKQNCPNLSHLSLWMKKQTNKWHKYLVSVCKERLKNGSTCAYCCCNVDELTKPIMPSKELESDLKNGMLLQ
jgi:hypothetical protein